MWTPVVYTVHFRMMYNVTIATYETVHSVMPPSPPLDDIQLVVIVWRFRGNIITTALC